MSQTERELFQEQFDVLGYHWSESNQEKAYLGWQLARQKRKARRVNDAADDEAWVIAMFITTGGEPRYVLEYAMPRGALYIVAPDQVEFS